MVTGLEVAIGKAALGGVTKIAGIGAPTAINAWSRKRALGHLRSSNSVPRGFLSAMEIDPDTASAVAAVFESGEADAFAVSVATALLLRECGSDPTARLQNLRNQFCMAVQLRGAAKGANGTAGLVFDTLQASVANEVANLKDLDKSGLPAGVKSLVIKSAAQTAAATSRNESLLQTLEAVSAFDNFKAELRLQISAVHQTMRLPHAGTTRQVPYGRLFVAPRLDRGPDSSVAGEEDERLGLAEHCESALRLVIVGDPGGGKSTLALKHTYDIAAAKDGIKKVPFLVILRDYAPHFTNTKMGIVPYLEALCELPYGVPAPENSIDYLLLNGQAVVIFDGLDELLDTSQRQGVVAAVEGFAHRYPTTPIIVTSRRVGYEEAPLDAEIFGMARLLEFDEDQVEAYARKWFSLDDSHPRTQQEALTRTFLVDSAFVRDLRINPLMLSLMCGIYASEHYIPRNRPDVYEKCALLLFERWDKQRGIEAPLSFDAHVQSAMRALALWLYPQQESQSGLPRDKLVGFITQYLLQKRFDDEDEARNAAIDFIDFCKGRAWVLTDVGSELYGFTHRTFLEYFTASQLVRQSPNPSALYEELRTRVEMREWDVVVQLALQILGRTVEDGADDFLALLVSGATDRSTSSGTNTASFAARALGFIVPRPGVLRSIVELCVNVSAPVLENSSRTRVGSGAPLPLAELLSASSENLPLISKYLLETCEALLNQSAYPNAVLKVLWFTPSVAGLADAEGSARRFWADRHATQMSWAKPLMLHHAPAFSWVAVELCEAGELSVSKLLEMHGVVSMFRSLKLNESRFFIFKAIQVSSHLIRGHQSLHFDQFVLQLHQELTRRREVWVPSAEQVQIGDSASGYANNLDLLSIIMDQHTDAPALTDPVKIGTFLALALPSLEHVIRGGRTGQYKDLLGMLEKMRRRQGRGFDAASEVGKLGVQPDMAEFLTDWVKGRFSVLGPLESGPTRRPQSGGAGPAAERGPAPRRAKRGA